MNLERHSAAIARLHWFAERWGETARDDYVGWAFVRAFEQFALEHLK